jgi:acyl-CoA synthetase (AMP-forming)/AMP-acid ligase II
LHWISVWHKHWHSINDMVKNLHLGQLVSSLFELQKNEPDKIVLIRDNKSITAAELFKRSKNVALNLLAVDFSPEDIAVIAMQPGEEFLILMYALLLLKAKIAIIDPEMGRENYAAKMKQLNPKWMFVDRRLLFLSEHSSLKKILFRFKKNIPDINFTTEANVIGAGIYLPIIKKYTPFKTLFKEHHQEIIFDKSSNNFDNLIVYTSGTLQEPKGVLHSNESLHTTITLLGKIIDAQPGDIVGTYLPHFMLLGIASGIAVKIIPVDFSASKKLAWLKNEKINIYFAPPSELLPLILECEKNKSLLPTTLTHILIGSAPVHQGFLKRLVKILPDSTKLTCTYGMTEHLLVAMADGREKIDYESNGDYLGKIVAGVDIKISEDQEILIRSKQMYSRYFHLATRDEWHASGDLGMIDNNGNLILLGRKKEMIIRRDFNIYPAIYESTIKKIKGINDAALIGIYDNELHDEKVYLAIEGIGINVKEITKHLEIGAYSIDKSALPDVIFIMELPRKGRQHKIDRHAIAAYIKKHNL